VNLLRGSIFLTVAALAGSVWLCCDSGTDRGSEPIPVGSTETADPATSPVARRPNVVLIILDTLRADRLGIYGDPDETSPALDALAIQGVQFQRVLSQSSWTRPSIGSLLTSRYPRSLGLYTEGNEVLKAEFVTLPELLHQQGYRTLGLTANPNINSFYNFHQGFDTYIDSSGAFRRQADDQARVELESAASLFARTLDLVKQTGSAAPVYLQLNLMDVHAWSRRKSAEDLLRPEYRELFSDRSNTSYLRLTRQLTDDLGSFIAELELLPGWHDTLFSIVSDHGEGLNDHPDVQRSRHHGVFVYQSQVVVPWILYRPGWSPTRSRISAEVRLLDMMPTLLDLLDLPVPEGLEGRSLRPLIDGTVDELDLPSFRVTETQFRGWDRIAVYGDDWEYIHNRRPMEGLPTHELQSRGQLENGVATDRSAEHPEIVDAMREYLVEWESRNSKAPPQAAGRELSDEEKQQLEAIGYLHP